MAFDCGNAYENVLPKRRGVLPHKQQCVRELHIHTGAQLRYLIMTSDEHLAHPFAAMIAGRCVAHSCL